MRAQPPVDVRVAGRRALRCVQAFPLALYNPHASHERPRERPPPIPLAA
jgi:hypothetical protein